MGSRLDDYIEAGKALDPDEREIAALALVRANQHEQPEVDCRVGQVVRTRE